jgi:hypothetical protein
MVPLFQAGPSGQGHLHLCGPPGFEVRRNHNELDVSRILGFFFFFFFWWYLGFELRASCLLAKCLPLEPHPLPSSFCFSYFSDEIL